MNGKGLPSIIAGRYQVLGELGRGGFGRVYRVQHLRTGETLALKVLLKHVDADPTAIERFQREARAPALIRSEHVVRITDADVAPELGDAPFLVMELLEGVDLQHYLARHGKLPPADVIEILRQIARPLDKAHAVGIIHRDLKPANVYLHRGESGVIVKLLDFGISKMSSAALLEADAITMTATGAALGTPLYMPPEQALGRQDIGPAADLWSTGMLAFTLLVGRPYFAARAIGELMLAILHDPLVPPSQQAPELPATFDAWFARSCDRDPAQRWSSAAEQVEALATALGVPASTPTSLSLSLPLPTESAQDTPPAPRSTSSKQYSGSLDARRGITREGERRQITVLYLSLRPTLETAEEVDPEELVEVLHTCKAACEPLFATLGAPLTRASGDGILAYFGYPVAYGDDARRAVSAGLKLVEEVAALAARLHHERRVSIVARVSVHTGLVAIHEGTPEGSSIIGQAIEVPRGLEHLVPANAVVMSGATERLVRGRFDYRPLVAPGQIPAFRVLGPHSGPLIDSRPASPVPLVGRDTELAILQERWEEAQSRQGQVVLVLGEAGMGKSSLLRAFRRRLEATSGPGPGRWLECHGSSLYQHTALQPLIDLLQRALGSAAAETSDERRARLAQLVERAHLPADAEPLLARLLSLPQRAPLNLSPQRQKQKTYEALLGWLHAQAAEQPLCLVIEDLHWADPSTLELLGALIVQSAASRLLLVLTAHPEFTVPWRTHAHLTTINLPRLPQRRVETLIHAVTGGKSLPRELLAELIDKTDGVPLFIEELTRAVLESGQLRDTGERYVLDSPLPTFTIPPTLRDSLSARLDRLGPAKLTAQLAAVVGREFDRELLAAITPGDESVLEQDLQRLVESDLAYRKAPTGTTYAFKHNLIHEAAYDSLLKPTRRQAHQRLAEVLTERHPQLAEAQPELLAHHHAAAGQPSQAVPLYLAAGRRALARQAHIEARAQLERGLALLESLPESEERTRLELELRTTLGVPLMVTRGYGAPEVEATYVRALELGRALGATRNLLTPLWGLWIFYHVRARYRTAHDLTDQLLQTVADETDPGKLLCAQMARGATTAKMGHFQEARQRLERTLALYDPALHRAHAHLYGQDPGMFARVMLSWVLWLVGEPDRALAVVEEAVTLAAGLSHPNSLAFALYMTGVVHQFRGEPERSLQRAEELLALAGEQALVHWIGLGHAVHGWSVARLGDVQQGLSELSEGVHGWQRTGARASRSYWSLALAETYAAAGRFDEGLAAVREAQAFIEESAEREFAAEAHRVEGELLAQLGDTRAALACIERARQTAADMGARSLELRAALSLAMRSQEPAQREAGRALLEALYRSFVTTNEGLETADLRAARAFLGG
ncbi:MAG TPA: TOMM system kinase/cyclase fusion protein [Polyangia bacterium]|nr:TOMM system kinase/cyclase fusion protein [Polyangia bacterium]